MPRCQKQLHFDDDTEEEKMDREVEIWKKHYSSKHRILLVGEGDFSFSRCLARAFGSARNMVATSLDTQGTCIYIYIYLLDPLLLSSSSFFESILSGHFGDLMKWVLHK